jgi:hypothetical protein
MTAFYIPIRNTDQEDDNAIFTWLHQQGMNSRIEWSGPSAEYLTFAEPTDALAFALVFGNVCILADRII